MRDLTKTLCLFVLFAAVSCAKSHQTSEGQVRLGLTTDFALADVTKSNVSDYTYLPSEDNFEISIIDSEGNEQWSGMLSEMTSPMTMLAGKYTAKASYGNLEDEGFDKPYFYGEQEFTVTGGETTDVSVTVSLANAVVKVACTENFTNYYVDYSFKLVRVSSEIATFAKGENKAAFVDPYRFTIEGTVETETGAQKTFETEEFTNLNVATAYTILFDISNVGGGKISISFNNTLVDVELGDLELND